MKKKNLFKGLFYLFCLVTIVFFGIDRAEKIKLETATQSKEIKTSGAGKAMDMWAYERSYPGAHIPSEKFIRAFEEKVSRERLRSNRIPGEWESLGPENIGGRMLSLAFHPTNPDVIYAGSASGGLWKTTTQGVGRFAWEYVPTGFPVLGVAAVAINQDDPDIIFIGSGEVYGVLAEPGTINRVTRGSYGIGILRTTDGGTNWTQVLPFNENEVKGVNDIAINSQNPQEIFAATTDGVYRSTNGGDNWTLVLTNPNCRDIEIDPNNGDIIYVTQGNLNTALNPAANGIFKSINGGDTFTELLDPGLLAAWSGMAMITIDPANSNILYASIHEAFTTGVTTGGIFKSTDAGATWARINDQNIARFQGWYSHDVAVNPADPSELMAVGISAFKSTDTGVSFALKSGNTWTIGEVSVEFPEGTDTYVHSDIHQVRYHPLVPDKVFFATDGGVFSSEDGGETFVTHNGGLQTTQFYADAGSSTTTPDFLIAGAQDNASYIYKGAPSWFRVLGGDGMSASVRPDDDQIVFGSSQGLAIRKSINGGDSFFNSHPIIGNEGRAFAAPYEIAPSNNDIMYAGATFLYKNTVGGSSVWNATSAQAPDGNNVITKIAISPTNTDKLLIATAPDPFFGTLTPKIFRSNDGGQTFINITSGMPNRVCKDIEFDPVDDNVIYATFSGFGSNHVFKSTNSGGNWASIDNGLPDLPTNTIAIDPLNPDDVYVGNDLGVYYSENGGNSWEVFSDGLPEAVMIYDLNVSPSNRNLRIATHGHGIWERDFVNDPLQVEEQALISDMVSIYPNPATTSTTIELRLKSALDGVTIVAFDLLGQEVSTIYKGGLNLGTNRIEWNELQQISAGSYFIVVNADDISVSKTLIKK